MLCNFTQLLCVMFARLLLFVCVARNNIRISLRTCDWIEMKLWRLRFCFENLLCVAIFICPCSLYDKFYNCEWLLWRTYSLSQLVLVRFGHLLLTINSVSIVHIMSESHEPQGAGENCNNTNNFNVFITWVPCWNIKNIPAKYVTP